MKPHASINALNNSIKSHVIYFINRFYDLIVKMQMLIVFHNQGGTFAANLAHSPEKADRKSTRLNSSHTVISYAVFCLKKKKLTATANPVMTCVSQRMITYRQSPH